MDSAGLTIEHIIMNQFLQTIKNISSEGYLSIFNKETKKASLIPITEVLNEIPFLVEESKTADLYFGLGLIKDNSINGRGTKENIIAIPGLWLDVDIGTENHSRKDYPPTTELALEIISEFPFKPTTLINSGYGLHCYWLFNEPWYFNNEQEKEAAIELVKEFQSYMINKAAEKGCYLDNTSDITRMLRLPGTINHKGGSEKPVEVIEFNGNKQDYFYNPYTIKKFLDEQISGNSLDKDYIQIDFEEGAIDAKAIYKKCKWMKHCRADSIALSEPEWYYALTIIAFCNNSVTEAHEFSKNYPNYNEEETNLKLIHAREAPGPVTCSYINENFKLRNSNGVQVPYCRGCRYHEKIKSPIQLGKIREKSENSISWPKEEIYNEWKDGLDQTPYHVNQDGFLCFLNKDGYEVKVANFIARSTKEVIIDNGLETVRKFNVEGILEGGIRLPTVEIPAVEFSNLDWLLPSWGIKPNLMPLNNAKSIVRSTIQALSKDVEVERVFSHIGWRKINDHWCYLHSRGCIGEDNVTILVDKFLDSYRLPQVDDEPVESLKASLELLNVAPIDITLPLLSLVYLAPLVEAFRQANHEPNFLLWLYGKTGSRKTSITTLFLSHFREYSNTPPATFKDTANALEKKAFYCKDSVLLIDDYHPTESRYEKEKMAQTAQHLIRLYGDKVGKGRMKADTSIRVEYPPKGLALITGEDFITGHSSVARCLGIELNKEDIILEKLTQAQDKHKLLAKAMVGYIKWLQPSMSNLHIELKKQFKTLRKVLLDSQYHGRMIETITWLQIGYSLLLRYAVSLGIYNVEEVKKKLVESLNTFKMITTTMNDTVEMEKPEILFLNTLFSLLDSKECIVDPVIQSKHLYKTETNLKAKLIGWVDKEAYYFIPEVTFGAVSNILAKQGKTFPISLKSLLKSMDEVELIQTEIERSENGMRIQRTVKKTINGDRKRLIHLKKDKLAEILKLN